MVATNYEMTVYYLLIYNLIIILVPAISIKFTRNFIIIFIFQLIIMALLTPILASIIGG